MISITSEMIYQSLVIDISLYFHCNVFWITSDFSVHLMQLTSKVQTPITFLFVKKNIKCGLAFSQLEHEEHFGTKTIQIC